MLGNKAGIVKDDASNLKRGILGIPGRIKDSITNKLNQRKEKKGLTQTQLFKSKEKSEPKRSSQDFSQHRPTPASSKSS